MNRSWICICTLLLSMVTAHAQAATLSEVSGTVLINAGAGFKPAAANESLPAGTQIMANLKGQAKVTYSDACAVAVVPGIVYTVAAKPPCTGEQVAQKSYACGGSMKDDDKCAAGHAAPGAPGAAAAAAVAPAAVVAGVVAAGAAIGIAVYQANRGNGRATSP